MTLHFTYGSFVCMLLSADYVSPLSVSTSPRCNVSFVCGSIDYVSPLTLVYPILLGACVSHLLPHYQHQSPK